MSKQLIINADDYGHTPAVSRGIREAHLRGIVTSTTAMMNEPGVEDGLRQAIQDCPRLGLGVHLNITSGKPVLPPSHLDQLIDEKGIFLDPDLLLERLDTIDGKLVKEEWSAQVERFVQVTGCAPDHLDSHHHISYYSKTLFQAMLELSQEYRCAIRLPIHEPYKQVDTGLSEQLYPQIKEFMPPLLAGFHPAHPDNFIASFYDDGATLDDLSNILSGLQEGVSEIMCHPGFVDDALMTNSTYNRQRETELAILTDPGIKEQIVKGEIELVSFSQMRG